MLLLFPELLVRIAGREMGCEEGGSIASRDCPVAQVCGRACLRAGGTVTPLLSVSGRVSVPASDASSRSFQIIYYSSSRATAEKEDWCNRPAEGGQRPYWRAKEDDREQYAIRCGSRAKYLGNHSTHHLTSPPCSLHDRVEILLITLSHPVA